MLSETVLLIGPDGINLGNHLLSTAEKIADEEYGMDLVEVRDRVYKILDLGKLKYEASKRKTIKAKPSKEMKFTLTIGDADFATKIGHVRRFLQNGNQVRVTLWFTGRQVSRPELGLVLMERIASEVEDLGTVSLNKTLQGRNMQMNVAPIKKS